MSHVTLEQAAHCSPIVTEWTEGWSSARPESHVYIYTGWRVNEVLHNTVSRFVFIQSCLLMVKHSPLAMSMSTDSIQSASASHHRPMKRDYLPTEITTKRKVFDNQHL